MAAARVARARRSCAAIDSQRAALEQERSNAAHCIARAS
jgi:hypothetical protein